MNIAFTSVSPDLIVVIEETFGRGRNIRPSASEFLRLGSAAVTERDKWAVLSAALDNVSRAKPFETEAEDVFCLSSTLRGVLNLDRPPRLPVGKLRRKAIRSAFETGLAGGRFDDVVS
ncbi:hypothetical protein C2U72_27180 [Prosthecomicrobium hirschii]|uniref:hypothetical protein n=1 Tax=Prosthecodimorpha hirschii TaxID=665126 RepID=UPI00112D6CD9|nr:hypothetical protein [Prosthecomicrobium hirschii]TPQ44995.1 hypothetical protein C2U72_27180 [Prosthecomicrobium hirschii]